MLFLCVGDLLTSGITSSIHALDNFDTANKKLRQAEEESNLSDIRSEASDIEKIKRR